MDFSVVLDSLGYSKYHRKLGRTTQLIRLYLDDTCRGVQSIPSGGVAECSKIDGSDLDVMEVVDLFKVTVMEKNKSNALTTGKTQLQKRIPVYISRKCCKEGYCRLEVSALYYTAMQLSVYVRVMRREIEPHEMESNFIYTCLWLLTQEYNGRYYISSKIFHDEVILGEFSPPSDPSDPYEPKFISNGPAMTCENVDMVMCLKLDHWSTEAKAWSSRERQNNWPNKEILTYLEKNVSCYVVPIGSKSSTKSDLEWRISFTEIECNLIWNMNDTQFKCFVLMKALNREYMEYKISTYHIKNVAFWLCEELPETYWKKDLLITCVKVGLIKLRQYVNEGYLPHYIVPNNNLFLNKNIRKPVEKKQALKTLDRIYNNLEDILLKPFGITYEMQGYPSFCQSLIMVTEYCRRCRLILYVVRSRDNQSLCSNMVKTIGKYCKDIVPCIRLALTKLKLGMSGRTDSEIDDFIIMIKKEDEIDYLTVALTCGVVYFEHNRYLEVRNSLIQKLKDGSNKIYITCEYQHLSMCLKSGDITHFEPIASKELEVIRTQRRHNLVMDFRVGDHELAYAVFPIKLQLILSGQTKSIDCNPLVLSCYMLYISEYNLDLVQEMEKTRAVFENVVSKSSLHKSRYIHLNMFGHSLYVTGDRKSAFKYFVMSSMAFLSSNNGAVYHIACMINEIIQKKCVPVGN